MSSADLIILQFSKLVLRESVTMIKQFNSCKITNSCHNPFIKDLATITIPNGCIPKSDGALLTRSLVLYDNRTPSDMFLLSTEETYYERLQREVRRNRAIIDKRGEEIKERERIKTNPFAT